MLNRLYMPSGTDHLFVGTDRYMYFTLSWNAETEQLRTEKTCQDLATKSARDTQTGERCLIDPTKKYLTLELYEGVITVLPIAQEPRKKGDPEKGTLGDPLECRIEELFVRASTFFQAASPTPKQEPLLALLYEDSQKKVRLKVRKLDYSSGFKGEAGKIELKDVMNSQQELELGASHLLPLDAPAGGLIILGETSITYYEHSENVSIQRPLEEATIFVTWEKIDSQRFVLADEFGTLYLLMVELDSKGKVSGWKLDAIGSSSRASVLVYLDAGRVFVGSHQGDSQVVEIHPQSLEVIQTFANIAPILDFTVMDLGNRSSEGPINDFSSGQARLVTGSGAFKDGSLRSVRSGVGLEDVGLIDAMENITDLFSVRDELGSEHVDILVVSFVDETRLFKFDSTGEVEELGEAIGLWLNEGTLLAANVTNGQLLQITNTRVRLTDLGSGMVVSEWTPIGGGSITAVTANDGYAVVSVGGSLLVVLDLANGLRVLARRLFGMESQVACLNVASTKTEYCTVGFWKSSEVSVLSLFDLMTVHTERLDEEGLSIARSLLVANVLDSQTSTLFAAMADGNVITYSFDSSDGSLSNKATIVLGTQQATFRALPRGDGVFNVFATCEHPSLIYGSEGRMVYAAVTADKASCVCPFDLEAFPGAIAVATKEDLRIAIIDEERSTHVRGLHVGETVRRIAYSPTMKAFGLGTIKRTLEDGAEVIESHFKLADEMQFNILATWILNNDELVESVMRASLSDGTGKLVERFVIGTAYLDDTVSESTRGRILILEVTEDKELKLVTEHEVKGACRCLAMVDGHIVAALVKTVSTFVEDVAVPPDSNPRHTGRDLQLLLHNPLEALPHQSRKLPHLDSPNRHIRRREHLAHRHLRPHEIRLHRAVHRRQRGKARHPHRSRASLPDNLGHRGGARRHQHVPAERRRGQPDGAAPGRQGRAGPDRGPAPPRRHQRDAARRNGEPHPAHRRARAGECPRRPPRLPRHRRGQHIPLCCHRKGQAGPADAHAGRHGAVREEPRRHGVYAVSRVQKSGQGGEGAV